MLTWPSSETTGLEVARATTEDFQKVMTELDSGIVRAKREARAKGVELEHVNFSFRAFFVIMSLDLVYDVGRNQRPLVYREYEAA